MCSCGSYPISKHIYIYTKISIPNFSRQKSCSIPPPPSPFPHFFLPPNSLLPPVTSHPPHSPPPPTLHYSPHQSGAGAAGLVAPILQLTHSYGYLFYLMCKSWSNRGVGGGGVQ